MEKFDQFNSCEISSDELLDKIKKEFEFDNRVSFQIETNGDRSMTLTIRFDSTLIHEDKEKLLQNIYLKLGLILKTHSIDITCLLSSGNFLEKLRLDREIIDGKLNWRRFLLHPGKFNKESKEILDEIAEFDVLKDIVERTKGDSLSKFSQFVSSAFRLGLINEKEKKQIEAQFHVVAN